jgi:hypothetical protein
MIKLATNNDAQYRRANVDRPIFVRFKNLMITESKIATLLWCFSGDSIYHTVDFFAFPAGSFVASWKPIEPPSSFVASC